MRSLALAGVAGLALLAAAAAPASAAPAAHQAGPPAATASTDPAAVLTAAQIRFFTTNDDKDFDTALSVQALTPGGSTAALTNVTAGTFPDNTTNGPFALTVNGGFTAGQLNNGSVRLAITPVGNDTWHFSVRLDLTFSDGTTVPVVGDNLTLSQDSRTLSVPMTTVGLVAVPDLSGDTRAGASDELTAVGLTLGAVNSALDRFCNFMPNTVMSQNPRAGALVPTGTAVGITLAIEPKICP
ncbi:MAG TPA: PASTA domain-containing protein [Mycobacteriales bacterium]|nr:PASTA domain-containing protein [Mycobacteriales bacterium]